MKKKVELIVGDNPFHGISHLSQEKARSRSREGFNSDTAYFAELVKLSLENGATSFMFSVSETTLSILRLLNQTETFGLYAIVPYAYEYVREATRTNGISGLAKKIMRQMVFSTSMKTVAPNILGLIRFDPSAFLKTYVTYELSRIKSAAGKKAQLKSILLHEIITDMALALDLEWLFKSYINFLGKSKIRPGFETRNFAYLVTKFQSWNIDFSKITIASPFNRIGFQMNPSKVECEKALRTIAESEVIAMSILAAGYFKPEEAISYIRTFSNLKGVVVGVSKRSHAKETFRFLQNSFNNWH